MNEANDGVTNYGPRTYGPPAPAYVIAPTATAVPALLFLLPPLLLLLLVVLLLLPAHVYFLLGITLYRCADYAVHSMCLRLLLRAVHNKRVMGGAWCSFVHWGLRIGLRYAMYHDLIVQSLYVCVCGGGVSTVEQGLSSGPPQLSAFFWPPTTFYFLRFLLLSALKSLLYLVDTRTCT